MSDDIVARLVRWHTAMADEPKRAESKRTKHRETADLIEQQAARIKAMERDVERYRSLIDATEINSDSFYWSRNEKAKSATIVAEMDAIFGMTEE